jgi:hypothetical protein
MDRSRGATVQDVTIIFDPTTFSGFKTALPPGLQATLDLHAEHGVLTTPEVFVRCDGQTARRLLDAAKMHYRFALCDVRAGLHQAGLDYR